MRSLENTIPSVCVRQCVRDCIPLYSPYPLYHTHHTHYTLIMLMRHADAHAHAQDVFQFFPSSDAEPRRPTPCSLPRQRATRGPRRWSSASPRLAAALRLCSFLLAGGQCRYPPHARSTYVMIPNSRCGRFCMCCRRVWPSVVFYPAAELAPSVGREGWEETPTHSHDTGRTRPA